MLWFIINFIKLNSIAHPAILVTLSQSQAHEVGRNSFLEINFPRKTFPAFSTKILLHEVKTNLATAVIYDHPAIQQSLTVRLQPSSNRTKNKKNILP